MIALIAALVVAIFILALAVTKPILFKMGIGYTKQRPKQTVFIVLGLMITTTVVAGAGIMADSAANSFAQDESSRYAHYDGVVEDFGSFSLDEDVSWEKFWAQPQVQALVSEVAPYRYVQAFLFDDENLGDNLVLYLLSEQLQAGLGADIPAGGVIINPEYASSGKLRVGDAISLEGSTISEGFLVGDTFSGSMTAFNGPTGWIVGPTTENEFSYDLEHVPLALVVNSTLTDYYLEITSPLGDTTTVSGNGEQLADVYGDGEDRRGTWQFSILSETVGEPFLFSLAFEASLEQALGGWEGRLTGVGADFDAPFYYHQSYAFGNLDEFGSGSGNQFAVKAAPGLTMTEFGDRLREEIQAFGLVGYPYIRSDNPDQEVALVRLAANLTFLSMGGLSIISGIILVVVLMGLLVEERKRSLGTMRALGATRGNLTFMHVSEGTVYAGLAGLTGIVGGVVLAAALLGAVSQLESENANPVLTANPLVYLSAGAGSALLILAVIAWSAYRISRIDIATAIRGEEQDLRKGRERSIVWAVIWCSLGGLFLLLGLISGNADYSSEEYTPPVPPGITLGVSLASIFFAIGLGPLLSKYVGRTVAMPAVSAVLLLHTILSFQYMKLESEWDGMGMLVRVMIIPVAFGILVAYSRLIHEGVVRVASRLGGVAALWDSALSSIRGKPGRNAMTIAVLGSVLMGMTAMGALFQTFSFESVGGMGGYEALVSMRDGDLDEAYASSGVSIDPYSVVDVAVFTRVENARSIFTGSLYGPIWELDDYAVGTTPEFVEKSDYKFQAKNADPWGAVLSGKGVVLGAGATMWDGEQERVPKLGSFLELRNGGNLEVVGILAGAGTIPAFVSNEFLEGREIGVFLKADDVSYAVRVWESSYRSLGAQGVEPALIISEEQEINDLILTFLTSFMGLGIIIGMISLGLTTTRNVLMRRQEIGVLRAIGARTRDVVTIFAIETAYVTTFSIILGLVGGIAMANAFVSAEGGLNYSLQLDWSLLAVLYSFTIIAAALAVTIPAIMASKIRPAEAVRYAE